MKTIRDQINGKLAELKALAETAKAAARELDDLELAKATELLNDIEKLENQEKAAKASQALRDKVEAALTASAAKDLNADALAGAKSGLDIVEGQRAASLSERFLKSDTYQAFQKRFPNGIPDKTEVKTDPVNVGGFKDLVRAAGSGGAGTMVAADHKGLLDAGYGRELTLRDIITVGTTGSDLVEYARLVSVTNNAAPVPEASTFDDIDGVDVTDADGGLRPFSAMTFVKVTAPVRDISHLVAATRKALADAGQLATIIDNFLRYGLEEETEDQIVDGDGTAENFEGILNVSGTQAQAWSTDLLVTIRKAKTKARAGRRRPTAVLLNPEDDERIDLMKDSTGNYLAGGPFAPGQGTVWGLPKVVTEAVPAGTGIVGDFRQAVLWDREQATITAGEWHKDWGARGIVAVRGDYRAAFGVLVPSAFVVTDLTA